MQSYCGHGRNGLKVDKVEGDGATPVGSFPILFAFGFEENFPTEMTYKKISPRTNLSGQSGEYYNKWVEYEKDLPPGDRLIDAYQFKYGMNTGFNINPTIPGKGSGIFVHCKTYGTWKSAGCVTLPEKIMIELLKKSHDGEFIIIVPTVEDIKNF